MKNITEIRYDTLKVVERRLEFMVGARLRHKDRILNAVKKLAELRGRLTLQAGNFNGVAEIRKWRQA